jgi:hypothetical protein
VQDLAGISQEDLALRRQDRTPAASALALEQALAETGLEPLDLQRDGRLRAPDALGRPREPSAVGDGHEAAEQIEIEGR